MKAYYLDKAGSDQRLPPVDENSTPVDINTLQTSGIEYRFIPVDNDGNWEKVGRSPGTGGRWTDQVAKAINQIVQEDPTQIETWSMSRRLA